MSDISNNNKQQIIDEYNTKMKYYNNLQDDVTNLQKAINDMKGNIKNTIETQNRMKQANYEIWSNLECKNIEPKTTEKEPSISDIIGSFNE